ncbi:ABC transporter permease [bacterium]|nr:ABC transporter permease [bacterium]
MRAIWCIFKKEIFQFFSAPASYGIIAVFLAVSGFFFYNITSYFAMQCIQAIQYQSSYNIPLPPMNVNQWVVRPFFHNLAILVIFLIPIITMRSYAAERNYGTSELLLTSPIRTAHLVYAKLASGFIIFIALIVLTFLFQIIIDIFTPSGLDWGPVWSGYLGLLLLGLAAIPVGQFISSLTKNQIVAAFMTFAVLLILWIVDWSTLFSSGILSKIVGYIGLSKHFSNFARGIIDTSDAIYFASVFVLSVFLTHQSVQSWRWRGA